MPRSTFYALKKPKFSARYIENKIIKEHILRIFMDSKGRYGAPKIYKIFKQDKIMKQVPSLKRIQRLMKKLGIRAIITKKYKPQKSVSTNQDLPNLLKQDFSTTKLNQKWVADITYIYTGKDRWCYLASILDLHSKKIVGYEFSKTMDKEIVISALNKAMLRQGNPKNVIIHSDRGSQYLSSKYIKLVESYSCQRSYSAKGNPFDNAVIESFHAILKKEEVYRSNYKSFEEANMALFQYIEGWYNSRRIHSSIDYMTPNEFEKNAA